MAKPFKFRYVNHIAGAFAALIFAVLIAGFVLAAHAQKWFEPVETLTFKLPHEGTYGIKSGAEIHMLGTTVGAVDKVTIDTNGNMAAIVINTGTAFDVTATNAKVAVPTGLTAPEQATLQTAVQVTALLPVVVNPLAAVATVDKV